MPFTFAQSQDEIARLVRQYRTNRDAYRAATYKEAQARQDLIDPLFIALGWDVHNTLGATPDNKYVVVEENRRAADNQRAPDYTFRLHRSERKFFAEAKKPGVNLKASADAAYQVRSYGWNDKLAVSILTDFEEFAVYNCRRKPHPADKPNIARLQYLACAEYPDRWRELWDVFSLDAVRGGAFDAYTKSAKSERSSLAVDADFLATIEGWRKTLAQNIEANNGLHADDLTDAVQRTIDRLVFLRIAEDREIEPYGALSDAAAGEGVYRALLARFRRADRKYNSGLFDFAKDKLTPRLTVDDKPLKALVRDLYGAYNFRIMPVEILGNVYEQFLGKVIRVTAGGNARVEEKPEVRKAGGVYYTPAYIVDYIVRQTLGKQVEGKSPKEVARLRVLDMACGSGSFLLGAYQFLLDWHLQWYAAHEPHKQSAVYDATHGAGAPEWRLTTDAKKRILLNNIYGVDIDRQAVEVTKLSLLLKVLADESRETLQPQLIERDGERALPNLDANIVCGNSLIGPDYFADRLPLDDEELKHVNPFDWQAAFPGIMQAGGFDVVIGNPPYVRQEGLTDFKAYWQAAYRSYHSGADLFVYFMEKGLSVLRDGGLYSIIVSSSFLRAAYGEPLRTYLREAGAVVRIVDFGGLAVFKDAKDTYVCIPLLERGATTNQVQVCRIGSLDGLDLPAFVSKNEYAVSISRFEAQGWDLATDFEARAFERIQRHGTNLGEFVKKKIFYGIKTGLNEAFEIDEATRKKFLRECPSAGTLVKPFLGGQEIRRFTIRDAKRFLIVIPSGWTSAQSGAKSEREGWDWLQNAYHPIARHLEQFATAARKRQDKGEFWWELRPCDYYDILHGHKIVYPDIAKGSRFYLDTSGTYISNTAYCLGSSDKYLLGILNSRVAWFAISRISIPFGVRAGEFRYRLIYQYMEQLPIRTINFADPADKARHDQMVALVTQMLDLQQRQHAAPSDAARAVLQNQIAAADRQIDALVYELYGLSGDEIKIVEGQ